MTLLEGIYGQLRGAGLVHCAEAFSRDYLSKNQNWYAFQKHTRRDFSLDAAVQCLRSIRNRQTAPELELAQKLALEDAEQALLRHLNDTHFVADVL
jgi:hypothetical protein